MKRTVDSGVKPSAREIITLQKANQEAIEVENYAYELQNTLWASADYVNEEPTHARKDAIVDFARGKVSLRIGKNDYPEDVIIGNLQLLLH